MLISISCLEQCFKFLFSLLDSKLLGDSNLISNSNFELKYLINLLIISLILNLKI